MSNRRLLYLIAILLITTSMFSTGCINRQKNIETMNDLNKVQQEKTEQSKGLANQITENMKNNTKSDVMQMIDNQEKSEIQAIQKNKELTFDQEMDNAIDNVSNAGNRILFKIVFAMSQNAMFGSFVCIAGGSILAFFYRKNKIAMKAYIGLAIVGPIIFIASIYLPAFMLYLYK